MTITIAGYLTIAYIIYLFYRSRGLGDLLISLFAFNLIFEGFVNIGYFAIIGNTLFKIPDLLQFVMAFVSFFVYFNAGERKARMPLGLILFIIILLINFINIQFFPYDKLVRTFNAADRVNDMAFMHYPEVNVQYIKTSVRMLTFLWNAFAVAKVITEERWEIIKSAFIKFGFLLIGWGYLEFILRNVIGTSEFTGVLNALFGNDSSIINELRRNEVNVIVGLNNEPSQFTMTLTYFIIFYIVSENKYKSHGKYNILVSSALILMLLSGSFRLVGLLPVILIVYLIKENVKAHVVGLIILLILVIVFVYNAGFLEYYLQRLGGAFKFIETGDATLPGGEAGRLNTIKEAFIVFMDRPLIGIGPGTTFAFGFIPSALATIGLLGTGIWYYSVFGLIGNVRLTLQDLSKHLIIITLTVMWIYTSAIDIAYSIVVLAIALEFRKY